MSDLPKIDEKIEDQELTELLMRQAQFLSKGKMYTQACILSHAKVGFNQIKNEKFDKLVQKAKMVEKLKITSMPNGREADTKLRSELEWLFKQVFSKMRSKN